MFDRTLEVETFKTFVINTFDYQGCTIKTLIEILKDLDEEWPEIQGEYKQECIDFLNNKWKLVSR